MRFMYSGGMCPLCPNCRTVIPRTFRHATIRLVLSGRKNTDFALAGLRANSSITIHYVTYFAHLQYPLHCFKYYFVDMEVYEKLKQARISAGFEKAAEAARAFGWNEVTYRSHENGTRGFRVATANKYARAFNFDVNSLLFPNASTPGGLSRARDDVVEVPVLGFRAGMGGGGTVIDEKPRASWPVQRQYLNRIRLGSADLIVVEVEGDSMSPTLESGDHVLINRKDKNPARGGMFAIHDSDTLVVKRIEKISNSSDPVMFRLISDNEHHNSYDVIADDTNIIGRIVWFARRI